MIDLYNLPKDSNRVLYTDLMLDFETLDTTAGAAIISMTAVPFNLTTGYSNKDDYFYRNVFADSCIELGMTTSPETLKFWESVDEDAKSKLGVDEVTVKQAVKDLIDYIQTKMQTTDKYPIKVNYRLWSKGASFDIPILKWLFNRLDIPKEWYWDYRNEMCVRSMQTLTRLLFPVAYWEIGCWEDGGIEHYAVDDCYSQIYVVTECYKSLYNLCNDLK